MRASSAAGREGSRRAGRRGRSAPRCTRRAPSGCASPASSPEARRSNSASKPASPASKHLALRLKAVSSASMAKSRATSTRPASISVVIRCQRMPWRVSPFSRAHIGVLRPAYCGSGPSWKFSAPRRPRASTSSASGFSQVMANTQSRSAGGEASSASGLRSTRSPRASAHSRSRGVSVTTAAMVWPAASRRSPHSTRRACSPRRTQRKGGKAGSSMGRRGRWCGGHRMNMGF